MYNVGPAFGPEVFPTEWVLSDVLGRQEKLKLLQVEKRKRTKIFARDSQ